MNITDLFHKKPKPEPERNSIIPQYQEDLEKNATEYRGFKGSIIKAIQVDIHTKIVTNNQWVPSLYSCVNLPISKIAYPYQWIIWIPNMTFPIIMDNEEFSSTYIEAK